MSRYLFFHWYNFTFIVEFLMLLARLAVDPETLLKLKALQDLILS